ncbi:MAG: hypothetical protein ACOY0R_16155 [Chloroflexota bacterium]
MTVKYTVMERGNPANPSAPRKVYPSVTSSGRKSLRQLSAQISTVSSADTMAALESET